MAIILWHELGGAAMATGHSIPLGTAISATASSPEFLPKLKLGELAERARLVTVKVLVGNASGSGILLQRQSDLYTLVTNAHVLFSSSTIRVQTPDGQIWPAAQLTTINFGSQDLALLQFRARGRSYRTAVLGRSTEMQVGDPVFAAGFPANLTTTQSLPFKFTEGSIVLVSPKVLSGGYQLGYTNDVEKGMSGGPVLDEQGRVIGINGMHPYPVWGDPYQFTDGSRPCAPIRDLMVRSSWAIPVERVLQLIRPALALEPLPTVAAIPSDGTLPSEVPVHVLWLRLQAASVQTCKPL
jgi:S1-C subfamily serine protease